MFGNSCNAYLHFFSGFKMYVGLKRDTRASRATSYFWRNLIKSKSLISCWLPGSGFSIELGRDRILGPGDLSLLPPQLVSHLHTQNVWFLYQARIRPSSAHTPDSWISSDTLGLSADLATIWNNFCLALTLSGIHLNNSEDTLQWSGGNHSGLLTIQNIYTDIANSHWHTNISGWTKRLWSWQLLLKTKFFTWLLTADCV